MPYTDTTNFWLIMICFTQFVFILMILSIGNQIVKENLDFRKRLGREFPPTKTDKLKVHILAAISYARMVYGIILDNLVKHTRSAKKIVIATTQVMKGLGSRVYALARVRSLL